MIHYDNNYYVMYVLFMVLLMLVLLLHVIIFSNCYKNVMVYKHDSPMSPPTNVNVASGTNN